MTNALSTVNGKKKATKTTATKAKAPKKAAPRELVDTLQAAFKRMDDKALAFEVKRLQAHIEAVQAEQARRSEASGLPKGRSANDVLRLVRKATKGSKVSMAVLAYLKRVHKLLAACDDETHPAQARAIDKLFAYLEANTKLDKNDCVTPVHPRDARAARLLVKSALENLAASWNDEDYDMAHMNVADACDHMEAAIHCNNGRLKRAAKLLNDMDTASRDEVDSWVWSYLFPEED